MAAKEKDQQQIELARKLEHVPWCDEYEKMISGMLYDCLDPRLAAARFTARRWANEYNTTFPASATDFPSLTTARLALLRSILGHITVPSSPSSPDEDAPFIEPPFNIDYGSNISLGTRFYANFNLTILDCALVTIGDRVMCGPNVSIYAATHETDVSSRRRGVEYARPVVVGDDVWIGGGATILPGVTVGKGSTIAAGSVVTKDVPPFSVVRGAPARVVKTVEDPGDEGL